MKPHIILAASTLIMIASSFCRRTNGRAYDNESTRHHAGAVDERKARQFKEPM